MKSIKMVIGACVAIGSLGMAAVAAAEYPERPIKLIVPFPAGGTTDTVARFVARGLSNSLKQQVVVDYKAGAATIIGADYVSKAEPDGYTLLFGTATTFSVNPVLYKNLPYSEQKSFSPIGIVGTTALVLLANQQEPATTLQELLKNVAANPKHYSYGSHGVGTTVHFAGEMLWSAADVKVMHVPYKGSSPAMTDLMGGQIPLSFDAIPAASVAIKSGRVKALAVTGESRSPMLPGVPSIAESGFPGFKMESWFAVVAPRGIPEKVQQRLEKALEETLADTTVRQQLTDAGILVAYEPSAGYFSRVTEDIAKLKPIVEANHLQQN